MKNKLLSSLLFFTFLLGLTNAGQESIQVVKLDEKISGVFPALSGSELPVAVSVTDAELAEVSSSVLMAESWLRTFVLAHYPSTKITTIVVGNSSLCSNNSNLVLLSLKNLFHSLTRWGLETQIKVSTLFSIDCFHSNPQEEESNENMLKLVFDFIKAKNSTFTLKLPENAISQDEIGNFMFSKLEKIGFLKLEKVNLITSVSNQRNPIGRKLNFIEFDDPLFTAEPPLPSDLARPPNPPESQIASPPQMGFAAAPELPPFVVPASPPVGFALPPCNPDQNAGAPFPQAGGVQKLWCVAKPSVPAAILQQAMDYACGDGGADCKEISAEGSCFHPDTLVAHASYAFNNYWQKNKRNGGTCSFGGHRHDHQLGPKFSSLPLCSQLNLNPFFFCFRSFAFWG